MGTAQVETSDLSVSEKQIQRTKFLTEFNQKIRSEMLHLFHMSSLKFKTPKELLRILKTSGPIILHGYYGSTFYLTPAKEIKDEHNNPQQIGSIVN